MADHKCSADVQMGLQVEQVMQGEALAVFSSTVSAIAWALEVQATMAKHNWSQEVLAHEHCEVSLHRVPPTTVPAEKAASCASIVLQMYWRCTGVLGCMVGCCYQTIVSRQCAGIQVDLRQPVCCFVCCLFCRQLQCQMERGERRSSARGPASRRSLCGDLYAGRSPP
jgi:hypothetical protein